MVYRWIFPTGHLENRAWDATLNASASDAMRDLQRVLPVPAGVGPFAFDGTPAPGAAGLRYFFAPTVYQCVVDDGETQAEAVSRCNATTRNNADLARISYDQQSADRDRVDGQHRDRIDLQEVYVSTPESGGGQSCWSNSASAGSGLDSLPSGQSHFVPIQETQHCWFQLRGYSPHSDPTNRPHSLNDYFYAAGGHPLVNLQTRQEVATPRGVMSPFFYPGVDHNTDFVNEGFEFDDLRQTLLALPAPSGNASAVAPASVLADPPVGTTQFQIAFLMNHVDHTITLQSAQRLDNSTTKPTTPKPTSPYSLVFRNASNAVVGSPLPFGVTTMGTHDGPITIEGQVLIADLPAGAASAEIDKDGVGTALLTQDFTAAAPQVTSFTSTPNGTHVLDLAWKGSDNDGPALSYSVYLQQHPGALRSLIASGLTDESYAFDTSFAPGTSDGVLTVEASDGFNIGTATVSNVSIAVKKPVVSISTPRSGATLVAARPLRLVGSAYDLNTMGELAGKNLTWSLDGKVIGTGQARTLTGLIAGTHTITLAAVSGGLSASRTYKITVVPDSDKDGMPNSFETTYSCLDAKHYDSAGDPDGDQLSSFAEWQHHTSPCRADTDKDGWSDGDEVAQGTDPKSAKLAPRPARIFLDTEPRSLGSCSSPSVVNLHVGTSTSTVRWTAASDEPFVSAKGGRTGAGTLTIAPACVGLPAGHSYRAQVGVENAIGQFYTIEVRFKS